jgi:hypothetical protein
MQGTAKNVIFISYRRGADSAVAGRLHDRLQSQLKNTSLFMDVTDIPLGSHFVNHIRDQVSKCNALIAVIGPGWTADIERLSDKDDFVRLEIEAALNRGDIPVIPVFVEGTPMPDPETLPKSLRALVYRSGITLSHENFTEIVDGRLTQVLEEVLGVAHHDFVKQGGTASNLPSWSWPARKTAIVGSAALFLAVVVGGLGYMLWPEDGNRTILRTEDLPVPEPQPSSGTLVVQLAALRNPDDARREWVRLSKEHPDLLGDKKFTVTLATVDGRIWYRLRVFGFDSETERNDLCDNLKLRGVPCVAWIVD